MRRMMVAAALTLIGAAIMYIGIPFGLGLVIWFFLALAIGLAVARWWALFLAAVPWPLGVGGGLLTGRYAFLGDGWQGIVPVIIGIGITGIATGVLLAPRVGTLPWYEQ